MVDSAAYEEAPRNARAASCHREIEPIALGEDSYRLVLRKFSRGLQALSPLRVLLAALIRLLEVLPVPPRSLDSSIGDCWGIIVLLDFGEGPRVTCFLKHSSHERSAPNQRNRTQP